MDLKATHELHHRRLSRNVGVGLALISFVAIVFGLTVVKLTRADALQRISQTAAGETVSVENN